MTRIKILNFDDYFDPNKVITNSTPVLKGEFTNDGLFSETIFGEEKDPNNLDTIGWIDFGDNYIISPIMFPRIRKLLKPKVLDSMIQYNKSINRDGQFVEDNPESTKTLIFEDSNIGLQEFRERFLELLKKYTPEESKELPEYRNIIKWHLENKVFINKLPVFSPKLRPGQISKEDKTFQFSEINNYYNFIISFSEMAKSIRGNDLLEDVRLRKYKLLYKLQTYANHILDNIINFIKGKRGTIRKNLLASRVNMSSRNVIAPDPSLRVNEIIVNYRTFLELYKLPLINLISRTEGKTYLESLELLKKNSNVFSKKIHGYMMELIKNTKGGIHAILNRNPSISIHSIQITRIVSVKKDIDDYTMAISNNILSGLGADFDGKFRW